MRAFFFTLICVVTSPAAFAETGRYIQASGGLQALPIKSSIASDMQINFSRVYPYSIELGLIDSRFTYGFRVEYLQHAIEAQVGSNVNSIQYDQVPIFLVLGLSFGKTFVFRPHIALGYSVSGNFVVIDKTGDHTGSYRGNSFVASSGADFMLFFGNKSQLGLLVSAGYRYQPDTTYIDVSDLATKEVLSSLQGYTLTGGLSLRF